MKLEPMPGYLIVEPVTVSSKSGMSLPPDMGLKQAPYGIVVALGKIVSEKSLEYLYPNSTEKAEDYPGYSDIKPGDKIFYGNWSGMAIKLDGKTFVFLKYPEILAVGRDSV